MLGCFYFIFSLEVTGKGIISPFNFFFLHNFVSNEVCNFSKNK